MIMKIACTKKNGAPKLRSEDHRKTHVTCSSASKNNAVIQFDDLARSTLSQNGMGSHQPIRWLCDAAR